MPFNEPEWIRLLFLLSDTQSWISEMEKEMFSQVARVEGKPFFRKKHYISAAALAHILERHYYKIPRHPGTAKFTIPVISILHWIREVYQLPSQPQPGTINFMRCMDTGTVLGHDQDGNESSFITVITNSGGQVITAFPGMYKQSAAG